MNRMIALAVLSLALTQAVVAAPSVVEFQIQQAKGVDPRVDYLALTKFGPWDDRNYQLTLEDLAVLPKSEENQREPIPAFYRVEIRKTYPGTPRSGDVQYPRSAMNKFLLHHEGYRIDGRHYRAIRDLGDSRYELYSEEQFEEIEQGNQANFLSGEKRITTPNGAVESAIAISPVDSNKVIAGTNGPGDGQKMWYSSDGGTTWNGPIALPNNTCCDPTVGWSSDGRIAYAATLARSNGVYVYRSTDFGQTWTTPVGIQTGGGAFTDKEYLHVDIHAGSPHKDNIYVAYHAGNVQRFSRSIDKGLSYSTPITIDAGGLGIGSDLTTDAFGNVYYFYPRTSDTAAIRVAKSTDGGATFAAATTVISTDGSYEFAVPSMETRKVFMYTSADSDLSGGPFHNSLYVSFTDHIGPETSNAATNHARVRVAYSRDGGTTWNTSTPHSTSDGSTVDRYQQWMKVDASGRVHIIYYDTRHSSGRSGVDLYYAYSTDGAVTWSVGARLTAVTSNNILHGMEWGDYQGLDMVLNDAIAIYTDNRDESGAATESVDVYSVGGFAPLVRPDYLMTVTPSNQNLCAGSALAPTRLTLRALTGYNSPVSLDAPAFNTSLLSSAPSFIPATLIPTVQGAYSTVSATTRPSATTGNYLLNLRGRDTLASPFTTHTAAIALRVFNGTPTTATLTAPAQNATGVDVTPTLTWSAVANALSYIVEVSSSPSFASILVTGTPATNSYALTTKLTPNTQYYWRVRAVSPCGTGTNSSVFAFKTTYTIQYAICANPNLAIPDNNETGASSDLVALTSGVLTDLNLRLKVTHSYVGDLEVLLTHVASNTTIRVKSQPVGNRCANDNIDATLDDEAYAFVNLQCESTPPAIRGTFRPSDALTAMDGRALHGTWRLTLIDRATDDVGTLTQWCLDATVKGMIFGGGF